ncbi:MAG: pantoate--beta-alanine ligase [Methylocapsa sp.]|nr:pantoate--beta-alanine ligase [Methylocapsa sp.]
MIEIPAAAVLARNIDIVQDVGSLRARLAAWRRTGEAIGLIPTMGALHAGHISLLRKAKRYARRAVVSIFVNPAQFAPSEDFAAYPRSLEKDMALIEAAQGDLVFAPCVEEMFAEGFATAINVAGPAAAGLEDRFRPTHFAGVALIVAKLFNQCRPDFAIFGEKDFQQLKVVERMARDLDFELQILSAPTVRETDGLALSSRNIYLAAEERARAPLLYAALSISVSAIKEGVPISRALELGRAMLNEAGFAVDYFEARHAESLKPIALQGDGPLRLLAAARLGRTRLIDNLAV